jgi:spore coat protein CotH
LNEKIILKIILMKVNKAVQGVLTPLLFIFLFASMGHLFAQPNFPGDDEVFRDDVVARVDITINPDTLQWIYDNPESNIMWHATFEFNNGTIHDTIENIGFRLRGNTSRQSAKKSFKVSFNTFESGRKYHGLEKMNLNGEHNDPSIARAKVCWNMLRSMDIPAPRSNHVEVYINQNYYGCYINVEHIDEEFVDSRFRNQDGNLYKCLWPADLHYLGSNPDLYKYDQGGRRAYDLKTNTELDDYSDLATFIDILNNTPINDLKCALEPVFNVEDYLKIMAFDVMTSNWDGYIFNKNNFYLYHNTETGQFEYIVYDPDNTFGIDWFGINWAERDVYDWSSNEYRPLYERLLQVQEFKDKYSYYLNQIAEEWMNPASFFPYLDEIRDRIYPYVQNDPYYPLDYGYDINDFTQSYETGTGAHVPFGLKNFAEDRIESLDNQIQLNDIIPVIKYIQNNYPGLGSELIINAYVDDDEPNLVVKTNYTIDMGAVIEVEMYDDGLHEDSEAGDKIYGALLGPFNTPTTITYFISAEDASAHLATAPCEPFQLILSEPSDIELYINEFMASNATTIADEYGEYDDWIEIFNNGSGPIWLGDKYLTDNFDNPDKWQFPNYTIQPNEFLIIWADDDPEQGEFHTNFKLNKGGEEIAINDNEASGFAEIDAYDYGDQETDISEGRDPDAGPDWIFYGSPTPGLSNGLSSIVYAKDQDDRLKVFPNPVIGQFAYFNYEVTGAVVNLTGQQVLKFESATQISVGDLDAGIYFLKTADAEAVKIIIQ